MKQFYLEIVGIDKSQKGLFQLKGNRYNEMPAPPYPKEINFYLLSRKDDSVSMRGLALYKKVSDTKLELVFNEDINTQNWKEWYRILNEVISLIETGLPGIEGIKPMSGDTSKVNVEGFDNTEAGTTQPQQQNTPTVPSHAKATQPKPLENKTPSSVKITEGNNAEPITVPSANLSKDIIKNTEIENKQDFAEDEVTEQIDNIDEFLDLSPDAEDENTDTDSTQVPSGTAETKPEQPRQQTQQYQQKSQQIQNRHKPHQKLPEPAKVDNNLEDKYLSQEEINDEQLPEPEPEHPEPLEDVNKLAWEVYTEIKSLKEYQSYYRCLIKQVDPKETSPQSIFRGIDLSDTEGMIGLNVSDLVFEYIFQNGVSACGLFITMPVSKGEGIGKLKLLYSAQAKNKQELLEHLRIIMSICGSL